MAQSFGGPWTDEKLEAVRRYFDAYARALKNQPFEKLYVDAFAGSGERIDPRATTVEHESTLFGEDTREIGEVKDGSVRIALGIEPPFGRYVLVDVADSHVSRLEALRTEYSDRSIDVVKADANAALTEFAQSTDWRRTRAAIFIDPYGMQVDWQTLEVLAATQAVDVALLFPTGSLNRMIRRDGKIPAEWEQRIDRHLGPCDWKKEFYGREGQTDLFPGTSSAVSKAVNIDGLRLFAQKRLKTIFPYVCDDQLELRNSVGAVMFHLFIACANRSRRAGSLAMSIARSAVRLPRKR